VSTEALEARRAELVAALDAARQQVADVSRFGRGPSRRLGPLLCRIELYRAQLAMVERDLERCA
jgi:hypothetical protein